MTLRWNGSDADGNDLVYALLYSSDGGESWLPVALDLTESEFDLDASQIAGGENVFFQVLASDGFHTAMDTVGPVTVVQQPAIAVASSTHLGRAVVGDVGEGAVMVENPGSGPLEIQSAVLDNPVFSITSPVFPVTVPAGRSLPLSVSFAPSDAVTDVGTLTIESDAVDEPSLQVTVEATGVDPSQPFLDVLEEPIVFPETAPGSVFHASVPILNCGGSGLTVELTSECEAFSIVADDTALTEKGQGQDMRTVSAGASIAVTVAFAPPSEGEFEGTLTIQSNDPGLPQASIALSGLGVEAPPAPMINPSGVVNAASFVANAIAPGAILSMFGVNFADTDAVAITAPLPDSLSGTSVEITDSTGMTRSAGLFGIFNAGQQINLYLDPATAVGAAELTLRRSDGQASTVAIQVEQVGSGIFFIQNSAGENVALANSLRIGGLNGWMQYFTERRSGCRGNRRRGGEATRQRSGPRYLIAGNEESRQLESPGR